MVRFATIGDLRKVLKEIKDIKKHMTCDKSVRIINKGCEQEILLWSDEQKSDTIDY